MDFCILIFPLLLFTFPGLVLPLDYQTSGTTERLALLAFKKCIVNDPQNTLSDWNESFPICNWTGITCCGPQDERVAKLDLSNRNLQGNISPFLSNLSCLWYLDLSVNFFRGPIPTELGSLSSLEALNLKSNRLEHEIPTSFSCLMHLRFVDLSQNKLLDQIPSSFFYNCTNLEYIDLSDNFLTGLIPSQIGSYLPKLETLRLYLNNLSGRIPAFLSNSSNMVEIDLSENYLIGELPSEIVRNMPLLETLHLSNNNLWSNDGNTNLIPFFASISNSTHLHELELAGNNLGGELPSIIGRMRVNLSLIQLQDNRIRGPIPPNIANLSNLTLLNLSSNLLNGSIPPEICHLSQLERVCLSNNSFHGTIPANIGALTHLGHLDLSMNRLSGSIPTTLADLKQLRELFLHGNLLSGEIPASLGKCINLYILDLSHNSLTGIIPPEVAGLSDIRKYFNLSDNFLSGYLPVELSKMEKVTAIDLSSNNFSGRIPPSLGGCEAVEMINFSDNLLQGQVPLSLGNLQNLVSLDLSHNFFSGEVPESLQKCRSLRWLNLSFNNFNGSIPTSGVFSGLTIESFLDNPLLCGSFGLPSCHSKKRNTVNSQRFLILLVSFVSTSAFLLTICCGVSWKMMRRFSISRKNRVFNRLAPDLQSSHPRITYRELMEATEGFDQSRLLGSGSFGNVYKGLLKDGNEVAVKVLQLQNGNSTKSFNRECQVLKRIRHRNLMRIITACSLPDFKALVLPFMANGSLESHLYPERRSSIITHLSLIERVNICSDIAQGMVYLHHHSPVQVIHCDLKPSNILLNDDLTAFVSDFGIARLVAEGNSSVESSTNSTANLMCGSIGYIAPEYGLGRKASTKGDVYSFGVLVLEIVTRKRPTDDMFVGGLNLHKWVRSHYSGRVEKVIDPSLVIDSQYQSSEVKEMWECAFVELIELGLLCTQDVPSTRPTMIDAAEDLERLKNYLDGDTTATFASTLGMPSIGVEEEAGAVSTTGLFQRSFLL